jgi:decaprenyl-phosphate phosphoribosyltransferase
MSTSTEVVPRTSRIPAAVRAMRPKQWVKNVLVATAPLAAGRLLEAPVLAGVGLAFVAFCLVSAAVYLVNDVRAAVTGAAGLVLAFAVTMPLGITLVVYVAIQMLYSTFLKHLPVVDLAVVASGFLLRAIAGGVATEILLSQWFLLVAAFGSFFMVAGKRYSEMKAIGGEAGTRRTLTRYSESYLRFTWMLAAVMVLISYSLWAFENRADGADPALLGVPWTAISIAPFTLGLLQYALEVDAGNAGEPEDVVLHDHVLQGIGVIWLVVISVGVFW